MLATVKRAVKAVVPPSAIRAAGDYFDFFRYVAHPTLPFDARNLRIIYDVKPMLVEDATWQTSKAAISSVFGDGERRGGINPGERRAVYSLIRHLKPARALEIGTFVGASTFHIALAMKANGFGRLTTVDVMDVNAAWQKLGLPKSHRDIAAEIGCPDIEFVTSQAQDYMREAGTFDFIFLDGDHRPSAVYAELSIALTKLAPDGVVLLHDYMPDGKALFPGKDPAIDGPHTAMRRVMSENAGIAVRPLGALPWPTRYGSNLTSLAIVSRV